MRYLALEKQTKDLDRDIDCLLVASTEHKEEKM